MRSRKKSNRCPHVLTSAEIEKFAEECLEQHVSLKIKGHTCTKGMLFRVVLLAAAWSTSIAAVCRRWLEGPSDQTIYNALNTNLPKRPRDLEKQLNAALVHALPRGVLKRARPVAIDWHEISYHGEPYQHANELCRGKPKNGTTKFHAYATACIVEKGHRLTLAYTWVKKGEKQTAVVARLLERVRALGLRIKQVLLDRGFFNVAMLSFLKGEHLPFVVPVVMRGRKPKPGKAAKGVRQFRRRKAGKYLHTLQSKAAEVQVTICVTYKSYLHHRTSKRCNKKLIFATWKVAGAPREISELYRKRFGIETSYRQFREARIRTCTRDPKLRLFYVGVALLLRNVWVWMHAKYLAEGDEVHPEPRLEKLRLADMLAWLVESIRSMLQMGNCSGIDCLTGKRLPPTEDL